MIEQHYLENAIAVFKNYKSLAEKSFEQLKDETDFHYLIDSESNSIAVIIRHMNGNMLSRWTDFLTTDGEKPDRNRDSEFITSTANKQELMKIWERGWQVFFDTLNS